MKVIYMILATFVLFSCQNKIEKQKEHQLAKKAIIDSMNNEMQKQKIIDSMNNEVTKAKLEVKQDATTPQPQAQVQTVAQPAKKGWSGAAKGAVIGAGVGAATGAISSKKKGQGAIIGGLVGAGVGAGTGAIIDDSKKSKK